MTHGHPALPTRQSSLCPLRPSWRERINLAAQTWEEWPLLPVHLRLDKVMKRAGLRDVIVENERLRDALGKVASQQRKTLGTLQANGIVFDGPLGNDPSNWQHVAFSIYTDLCEVDSWARAALETDD